MDARTPIAALAALLLVAASSSAVTCESVGGPAGGEVTVALEITSPAPGGAADPDDPCGEDVTIRGTFSVLGPAPLRDVYVVIDASGSAAYDSGVDVDLDGVSGEADDDSVYAAEITAARALLDALDPSTSRVAIIRFAEAASVLHVLSSDFASVDLRLRQMLVHRPAGGTLYVPAMASVEGEVLARGEPSTRLQRCVFLSDGQPNEPLADIEDAAEGLEAADVVVEAFALGGPSPALELMATVTGGRAMTLDEPGDIVGILADAVSALPYAMTVSVAPSGSAGTVVTDPAAGTFVATVRLVPGPNTVTMRLETASGPSVRVDCPIDLVLGEPPLAIAVASSGGCGLAELDGSGSLLGECSLLLYRWVDCRGAIACPFSTDPTCVVDACGACSSYRLEIVCSDRACTSEAVVSVTCGPAGSPSPRVVSTCGLEAELDCGYAGADAEWDLDEASDSDGDGDPTDDSDATGCSVTATFATPGRRSVRVRVTEAGTGCEWAAPLIVDLPHVAPPRRLDGGVCPGLEAVLGCGRPGPGVTHWWDLDATVDGDGDGDPARDVDASGCDVAVTWPDPGTRTVHAWERAASGCETVVARGTLLIDAGAPPGEAGDLRVLRDGASLRVTWSTVPGAEIHRLLRGTLESLWLTRAYDHAADARRGQGQCEVADGYGFVDPDDTLDGEDYYYLATGVSSCSGEGPTGFGWNRAGYLARPPRIATVPCP